MKENRGIIIILDLDNFSECCRVMGWATYKSNQITRLLTNLIEDFCHQFYALELWGVSKTKGTEEAILVLYRDVEEIYSELDRMRSQILLKAEKFNAPTSISIGVARGEILESRKLENRKKSTLNRDPLRGLAFKAVKEAKRKGGNRIVIY